jgi:hypothetical protein
MKFGMALFSNLSFLSHHVGGPLKRNHMILWRSSSRQFHRTSAYFSTSFSSSSFSHNHPIDWLLSYIDNGEDLSDFGSILSNAGIHQMALIRHGNTGPAEIDFQRQLTPLGQTQARIAGETFGKKQERHRRLLPFYPKILFSPAPRTEETARIFVRAATNNMDQENGAAASPLSLFQWISIPVAYDGTMQPGGNALFRKIGYAPLMAYTETMDIDDRTLARTLLGQYAHDVMVEIQRHVLQVESNDVYQSSNTQAGDDNAKTTLLFFGHAIYISALALGIASQVGGRNNESNSKLILETFTREAEGFLIPIVSSSSTTTTTTRCE